METRLKSSPRIFIGRKNENKLLNDLFEKCVLESIPHLVFIHGEAGSGKTALVEHFFEAIHSDRRRVIIGRGLCSLEKMENGLTPFVKILESLEKQVVNWKSLGGNLADFTASVAPAWLDLVTFGLASPITVTLREGAKLAKGKNAHFSSANISIQYTNAISQIAKAHPLIIFIDDVQWADESSINLLFHLFRNIQQVPLLIIAAFRTVEALETGPNASLFRAVRANLLSNGSVVQEIQITKGIDLAEYVQQRYKTDLLPQKLLESVSNITEGYAIFVIELFNLWEQKQIISLIDGEWRVSTENAEIELPNGLGEVIRERVRCLNDSLRSVITSASIEGEDFSAQTVGKFLSLDDYMITDRLAELEKHYYLINEKGFEEISHKVFDFYRFSHRFIQHYIYNDLSASQKRLMHQKIGICIEALFDEKEQVAAQLARHFEIAGDFDKSIQYMYLAAKHEQNRFSWSECEKWCVRGLEAIQSAGDLALKKFELGFLELSATGFYYSGNIEAASRRFEECVNLPIESWKDLSHLLYIYAWLCDSYECINQYEKGLEVAIRAKKIVSEKSLSLSIGTFTLIDVEALLRFRLGQIDLAESLLRQIIPDDEKIGLSFDAILSRAGAYSSLGHVLNYKGMYSESMLYFKKSIEIMNLVGLNTYQVFYMAHLAEDLITIGRYQEADDLLNSSRALAIQIGDKSGEAYVMGRQGKLFLGLGEYQKAVDLLNKALLIADVSGMTGGTALLHIDLAIANLRMGETNAALSAIDSCMDIATTDLEKARILCSLGEIDLFRKDFEKAAGYLADSLEFAEKTKNALLIASVKLPYARSLLGMGDKRFSSKILKDALECFEVWDLKDEIQTIKVILSGLDQFL